MGLVTRVLAATLLVATMMGGSAGIAAAHEAPGVRPAGLEIPIVVKREPAGGGRPAVAGEPNRPTNRVSGPTALVSSRLVSATVSLGERPAAMLLPDAALPWRFLVDTRLAQRFGTDTVVQAVRQWDGIPGSRWATAFAGTVANGSNAADGRSVVFQQQDCPRGVGGYAYWQTATAQPDVRYGESVVYLTDVDVAVCSSVTTLQGLREIVAHEVGHAFGLQHLWNPGQEGWREGMGRVSHECRIMYGGASRCGRSVSGAEHDAAVHVYPTLRRVAGPNRLDTSARASYANFASRSANTVVLARGDQTAHPPLAAAALAAVVEGPMLLGVADAEQCVTGSAAEELARVAADRGKVVLVGDWPQRCEAVLARWGLAVERAAGADPVALGVAVAQQVRGTGRMGGDVFIVSAAGTRDGHLPDGVAAGAAAGATRGPVLFTAPDALSSPVQQWLRETRPRRAYVVGGPAAVSERVVADLRGLGVEVVRVGGGDRVGTALALAGRRELFPAGGRVIFAAAHAWADAVTGSAVGGRLRAPVLLTPPNPHPEVTAWLSRERPAGGLMVGGRAVLPEPVQWHYTRLVR